MKVDNNINRINKLNNKSYTTYSGQNIKNDVNVFDNFDVSNFDLEIIDYKKLTKSTLEVLSKNYKNINIYILEKDSATDIKNLGSNLGNGVHLVISKDFIDKMGSSEEVYNRGKAIIEQTIKNISNSDFGLKNGIKSFGAVIDDKSINFWIGYEKNEVNKQKGNSIKLPQNNFLDSIKNLEKQGDDLKNKFNSIKKTSNIKIPMDVYSKLAGAKSKSEVMNVVSMARSNIAKLKKSLKGSNNNEKIKIRAVINQLEKAITRSYRKIKDLASEDSLVQGRNSSEIKDKKRLAAHKNEELNRRRVIRRIREKAQIDEANPLYYYPQMFLNKKYEDDESNSYIQTIDISALAPTIGVLDVSAPETSVPSQQNVDITVMAPINISL